MRGPALAKRSWLPGKRCLNSVPLADRDYPQGEVKGGTVQGREVGAKYRTHLGGTSVLLGEG